MFFSATTTTKKKNMFSGIFFYPNNVLILVSDAGVKPGTTDGGVCQVGWAVYCTIPGCGPRHIWAQRKPEIPRILQRWQVCSMSYLSICLSISISLSIILSFYISIILAFYHSILLIYPFVNLVEQSAGGAVILQRRPHSMPVHTHSTKLCHR